MHLLLRLSHSGLVGLAWSAPPCKEFSRLKLRRPGPKALRTPEYMDGVPGQSPAEQARVDASAEIHRRSRALLRGVVNRRTGRTRAATVRNVVVARRQHRYAPRVGSALQPCRSMFAWHGYLQELGTLCLVPEHSSAGKQLQPRTRVAPVHSQCKSQRQIPQRTEYPASLSQAMADLFAPYLTQQGWCNASIADFANLTPETYVPHWLRLCDGAGMHSTADHSIPSTGTLKKLTTLWIQHIHDKGAVETALAHLEDAKPEHPFDEQLQESLATITAQHLLPSLDLQEALRIAPGQPYRLTLLQAIASQCSDPTCN